MSASACVRLEHTTAKGVLSTTSLGAMHALSAAREVPTPLEPVIDVVQGDRVTTHACRAPREHTAAVGAWARTRNAPQATMVTPSAFLCRAAQVSALQATTVLQAPLDSEG